MHGFCVWFDVTFDPHHTYKSKSQAVQGSDAAADSGDMRPTGGQVVVLSTAPGEKPTHWKQTFILLPADRGFPVNPDTSTPLPPLSCRVCRVLGVVGRVVSCVSCVVSCVPCVLGVVSAYEMMCVQCSDNGQHGDDHR
jgi:hypothetical protein